MSKQPFPDQPIIDARGAIRFERNQIVDYLLDNGGLNLNDLAFIGFPQRDWEQFYQLIGYSLCGYHELSLVSDETCKRVSAKAREAMGLSEDAEVGCRDTYCGIHSGVEREE